MPEFSELHATLKSMFHHQYALCKQWLIPSINCRVLRHICDGNWREEKSKYIHQVYKSEAKSSNSLMLRLTEHEDIFLNTSESYNYNFIKCGVMIFQLLRSKILDLYLLFISFSHTPTSNSPVNPSSQLSNHMLNPFLLTCTTTHPHSITIHSHLLPRSVQ